MDLTTLPEGVVLWLALLDAVLVVQQHTSPHVPHTEDRVSKALDVLDAHEHTLSAAERVLARETAWLRDQSAPLPPESERRWWSRCHCKPCRLQRWRGTRQALPTVRIVAPIPKTTEQGDLFHADAHRHHR